MKQEIGVRGSTGVLSPIWGSKGKEHFSVNRHVLLFSTLVLAASSLLTGCIKKIQTSVPAFAQAVALTTTNVQGAFDTVQGTVYDAQVMNYVVNYDGNFDPAKIGKPWIPKETLAARMLVLQGLKQYASELSSLTSYDVKTVDQASSGLGTALKGLTATAPFKSVAANANFAIDIATSAVDALGNWLIENKLRKGLPDAIVKMDKPIQDISKLLIADIGVVDADPEHPTRGSGLRHVLWLQYNLEIEHWNSYVKTHYLDEKVNPDGRLAAIKQLAALATQQRAADQTLAQVAVTIKQMADAHTQLLKAAQAKQSLMADVGDLLAEAQRLNAYYQSLATSK